MSLTTSSLASWGCTAWYPLNGNTKDLLAQNHATGTDITYINDATGETHASFNGTTSKIAIPATIVSYNQGTIACWLKCNASGDMNIITKSRTTAIRMFTVGYWFNDNKMKIFVQSNNNNAPNNWVWTEVKDPYRWHFVVITGDGSTYKIYINGSIQTLTVGAGTNAGGWSNTITSHDYYSIGSKQYNYESESFYNFEASNIMFFNTVIDRGQVNQLMTKTTLY